MKKLLLISALMVSGGAWASDCSTVSCYNKEIKLLNNQLDKVYSKLLTQTDAKKELNTAQKSWLDYKNKHCGEFTLADAGTSNGQVIYDLSCQSDLIKSRIGYLKSITTP